MTAEPHVTSDTVTPERVTNEEGAVTVTPPKRDRAAYMREYRARQPDKSNGAELNPEIEKSISEPVNNNNPQSELKSDPPISAEQYHEQAAQHDEAAQALKKQIEELRKSEQLNRQRAEEANRQQQQAAEANQQLNKLFQFWQQSGLSPREEQALRSNPELMVRLTDFAMQQASEHGHAVGSVEHTEATRKLFREHLAHLHDQAMASQQSTEPAGNGHIAEEPMAEAPEFFRPPPPKPMPQRAAPVSAPVSRSVPDGSSIRPDWETGRTTLSVAEKEAARMSGVDEVTYAKNKLLMLKMKAEGSLT